MKKQLRDAVKRFIKLYDERNDFRGDVGYVSITEEIAGVATEIAKLTAAMLQDK